MRRSILLTLAFITAHLTSGVAQTTAYQPGTTPEGTVYYLPKTAIRFYVQVERTTCTPGEFSKYAERYLRLTDAIQEPSVSHRVLSIRQEVVGVPDRNKSFAIRLNPKTATSRLALSDEGLLLAVNAEPKPVTRTLPATFTHEQPTLNPRDFMSQEILAAGSTAKMAQLTAQEIYDLRENRNLLIKGQADFMPKDGLQLQLMLDNLDLQNQALTQMFAGTVVRDTTETVYICCPERDIRQQVMFRISERMGLVDDDDLSGAPYYITIEDLHATPDADTVTTKQLKRVADGFYVNVPGKMRVSIHQGNQLISSTDYPAAQFGHIELLSGQLFNKRFTTHLWLNPTTGGIEKIEADDPK